MADLLRATPLFAMRAVALDTETTGLDVKRSRLLEIAAVHLDGVSLDEAGAFRSFVACDEPIPPSATAIHRIDAAVLTGAPAFAAVFPKVLRFLEGRVVVGHTIGFDLAMLAREAERAGLLFEASAALDVRLLAQIAEPRLPDYSLEGIAAWLEIEPGERHQALGDALAAGRIMAALSRRLRAKGIRTVGEALAASRRVADAVAGAAPAGWEVATPRQGPIPKLDSYPYRHRVREAMNAEPCFLPAGTRLAEAIAVMGSRKLSSVFVGARADPLGRLGIVTERDVLRFLGTEGAPGLAAPIDGLATRPVLSVPADAFLYRAIGRMSGRRLRHLAVTDEGERVIGVVTTRDLLRLRAETAVALGDEIDAAEDRQTLGRAFGKLPAVAAALLAEDVESRTIAAIVAREVGAFTRRAAMLAERELAEAGAGIAPCAYAVLVLGSAGRGESLLAMDQDNAIVFAEGEPEGEVDGWFARLGARMTEILDEVGVPLCKGGVMASKPAFRGSLALWRQRIGSWLGRSRREDLLAVDIVFDFRAVHGDLALAERLWREAWEAARGQTAFLKLLSEAAGEERSAIGLLGRLRTEEDGRIDLKLAGLKAVVTTARVLALRHGVMRHATHDRLSGLASLGIGGGSDLAALDEGHAVLLDAILRQQLRDVADGRPLDNRVDPKILGAARQAALRDVLRRTGSLAEFRRDMISG